jgi:hypothetical protein
MPEHRVNMPGDLRPVLGTDVSTAAKVFGRHVVSRTVFDIDCGQDLDRRGDLRAGGQEVEERISSLPNSSLPGLTRQSAGRGVDTRVKPGHDEGGEDERGDAIKIGQRSCG